MKKPVAGIAMGLITDTGANPKYAVLSDILGDEDHLGDMDFKVTGTRDGITATQMDIKCDGLLKFSSAPSTRHATAASISSTSSSRPSPPPARTTSPRAPHRHHAHSQGA